MKSSIQNPAFQKTKGSASAFKLFCAVIFIVYLAVLVYFCFFSEQMGRIPTENYRYNFVPFRVISQFIAYKGILNNWTFDLNIYGNIVAFAPLGVFIPYIFAKFDRWNRIFVISLLFSLIIETIQLVTKTGTCDVDDLFLNTLGGMLGFFIYRFICRFVQSNA